MRIFDFQYDRFKKISKIIPFTKNYLKLFLKDMDQVIFLTMSIGTKNWGDALNLPLVQQLSGKTPVIAYQVKFFNTFFDHRPVYSVIGSISNPKSIRKNSIIWGSGFIDETVRIYEEPQKICAVRGPLTRDLILECGFDCPNIFGDPALLYPLFYQSKKKTRYKLGIIPHYIDQQDPLLKKFFKNSDVLIINILGGINKVIDDICSCGCIASSSLHGIIASDAYRKPSIWMKISDNVAGDGFKFKDYFESVHRSYDVPFSLKNETTVQDIVKNTEFPNINIDLKKLFLSCPFKKEGCEYEDLVKHMKNDQVFKK